MAGEGLLSKDTVLRYSKTGVMTEIPDLQEVPDLGAKVEKVEVTTLADAAKRYIAGIKDYGDLTFKFLYDNSSASASYRVLRGLETSGAITPFEVELPDGTIFAFSASVVTKIEGSKPNSVLTFAAELTLNTDITVTNPA